MKWSNFVYLFIGIILPTYNLLEWVGDHFGKRIKKLWRAIKLASKEI
jgi:hypothetical protein